MWISTYKNRIIADKIACVNFYRKSQFHLVNKVEVPSCSMLFYNIIGNHMGNHEKEECFYA